MNFIKQPIVVAWSLALAGCAAAPGGPVAPASGPLAIPAAGVTAIAHLDVRDLRDRRLLAGVAVTPWVKADIDHVKLALFKGAASSPVLSFEVASADLSKQVRFTNLVRHTTYRIEARAWADAAEANAIDRFDSDADSCTTTFATTDLDAIDIGSIKLRLKDKTFAGETTGSAVEVTDGAVVDTMATEGVEFVP